VSWLSLLGRFGLLAESQIQPIRGSAYSGLNRFTNTPEFQIYLGQECVGVHIRNDGTSCLFDLMIVTVSEIQQNTEAFCEHELSHLSGHT